MFHVTLDKPKIPSNTGAIIRLSANVGCQLHLIQPLAFDLDDKRLRRAGLDYHEYASVKTWESLEECILVTQPAELYLFSTKAKQLYHQAKFIPNSMLIFGSETQGFSQQIFNSYNLSSFYRLPMLPNSRSINLANSVSIVVYEAWKQNSFLNGV